MLVCWLFSVTCGAPPEVEHGRPIGGTKEHHRVNSIVRYQCDGGYTQRHLPVIRCMANGQWEEPQVECIEGEIAGTCCSDAIKSQRCNIQVEIY